MAQDDDFVLDDLDSLTFEQVEDPKTTNLDQYGVWVKSGPEDLNSESQIHDDDEDFLNMDELADLSADLDLSNAVEMDGEDIDESEKLVSEEGLDNSVQEIELDEFVSFDDTETSSFEEEVLATSLMAEDQGDEDFLDIDIDVEDSIADDELEILEGSKVKSSGFSGSDMDDSEEIDLSSFDEGFPKSEASDFSTEFDEVLSNEKDLDLDMESMSKEPDMEELDSIEENLTSPMKRKEEAPLSEVLLKKIESELSNIKTEISSLKDQIGKIKPGSGTASAEEEEIAKGGFFSDDDDEVIALTGDELDSILSSADVMTEDEDQPVREEALDILSVDAEGNPLSNDDVFSSDIDLLGGTDLEDSLNEDTEVPSYQADSPMPGGSGVPSGVPDDIYLEEDTMNLLSDEDPQLGDIDALDSDFQNISEDEIDFSSNASVPDNLLMVPEEPVEDVSSNYFDEGTSERDFREESLEIPFDDEISLDSSTPERADEESFSPTLMNDDLTTGFDDSLVDSLPSSVPETSAPATPTSGLSDSMRDEIKSVLTYMDKLLASLPDEKIQEFADSEHFEVYKKLFEELGLTE